MSIVKTSYGVRYVKSLKEIINYLINENKIYLIISNNLDINNELNNISINNMRTLRVSNPCIALKQLKPVNSTIILSNHKCLSKLEYIELIDDLSRSNKLYIIE